MSLRASKATVAKPLKIAGRVVLGPRLVGEDYARIVALTNGSGRIEIYDSQAGVWCAAPETFSFSLLWSAAPAPLMFVAQAPDPPAKPRHKASDPAPASRPRPFGSLDLRRRPPDPAT